MNVYKFGGASVNDANGVRNVANIIGKVSGKLVVVVSAMGKMTNALEVVADHYFHHRKEACFQSFDAVKKYHLQILTDLFGHPAASERFNDHLRVMEQRLNQPPSMHYDFEYDQIVSFGELFSTSIVCDYLISKGLKCVWTDSRTIIKTDDLYRDANVDWDLTKSQMVEAFTFQDADLYLTQGFLGGTLSNLTTTLGREGSDYTAAIIGHVMDAQGVTIWKDVPGVLNADPRWYPQAEKINELSYNEAIELTFYGAQVIHPKTLKPLQNKEIPLFVRSFIDPDATGTVIRSRQGISEPIPVYVLKRDQFFVTVYPKDFSFIMEDKLIDIISVFKNYRVKMNLMQSSALNFSACFDRKRETQALLNELSERFTVRYNEGVDLLTIRQYTPKAIDEMTINRAIIDSQITRKVARFVLKKQEDL